MHCVRELTEPTLYGPDDGEGDGRDADLNKLIRCVRLFDCLCVCMFVFVRMCRSMVVIGGTFDPSGKKSLRMFLDTRRRTPGEGELGLGADELRELKNAVT